VTANRESWYWKNRDKALENHRLYYQANKAARNAKSRAYRLANPEKSREYGRRYRAANADKIRERGRQKRAANRDVFLKRERQYRARRGIEGRRIQHWTLNHGMRPEDWMAIWDAQDGRCYLCGDQLELQSAHIDHDHSCCPKNYSCMFCRRGLACPACNQLIGMAAEDPVRLRRIAANLETALAATAERLAAKPEQLELLGHQSITTTAGYAAIDMSAFAPTVNAIPSPLPPDTIGRQEAS
jgi:hypothetical protein